MTDPSLQIHVWGLEASAQGVVAVVALTFIVGLLAFLYGKARHLF
jgi:hypothetical protein